MEAPAVTSMELSDGNPSRNERLEAPWGGGCSPRACGAWGGVPEFLGQEDGLESRVWGVPPGVLTWLLALLQVHRDEFAGPRDQQ